MAVAVTLWGVAALLGIAVLGVAAQRTAIGSRLIYSACLLVCLVILVRRVRRSSWLGAGQVEPLQLPVGLPWIGARFAIDALAAFFLAVVNLGAAAASLYALGYGEHEKTPGRVLPFYPAFLAGMNLVILAADAFSFLFAWEFMSLTSWLLVMTYHHDSDNRRAGYIYIVMASFGTLALLLAFGLLAGPVGSYAFADMRGAAGCRLATRTGARARAVGSRLQGRDRAAPRVAAARTPGRAEPCLGVDERRHDQGGDLRLHSHRIRSAGAAGVVVGQRGGGARQRHGRARRAPCRHAARPQAAAGLQHRRECRHHLRWAGIGSCLQGERHDRSGSARLHGGAASRSQSLPLQELAVLRRGSRARLHGRARHREAWRPHSSDAVDGVRLLGRLRRHLRAAAAQRVRLRVAGLPGRLAQSRSPRNGD